MKKLARQQQGSFSKKQSAKRVSLELPSQSTRIISGQVKKHLFPKRKFMDTAHDQMMLQRWLKLVMRMSDQQLKEKWHLMKIQVKKALRSRRSAATIEIKAKFFSE